MLEKSSWRDRDRVCAKFESSRQFRGSNMNPKKKSRRCRGHGLDSGLDLAISRFIYSFGANVCSFLSSLHLPPAPVAPVRFRLSIWFKRFSWDSKRRRSWASLYSILSEDSDTWLPLYRNMYSVVPIFYTSSYKSMKRMSLQTITLCCVLRTILRYWTAHPPVESIPSKRNGKGLVVQVTLIKLLACYRSAVNIFPFHCLNFS
jgi:hypothetical protein